MAGSVCVRVSETGREKESEREREGEINIYRSVARITHRREKNQAKLQVYRELPLGMGVLLHGMRVYFFLLWPTPLNGGQLSEQCARRCGVWRAGFGGRVWEDRDSEKIINLGLHQRIAVRGSLERF